MKNALPLIIIAFAISGCAASAPYKPEVIQLPSGKAGYNITCTDNITTCYKRSNKACPTGYQAIDKTQSGGQYFHRGHNQYVSYTDFSLLIKCKDNNVKRRKPKK